MNSNAPCLAQTLRAAARLVTRRYEEALRPAQLTASQFTILRALHAAEALGPTDLGRALALDQTTATRLLAKMQQQGLIDFTTDEIDARKRLAHVTDAGRARFSAALPLWEQAQTAALNEIPAEDWQSLQSVLKQLSKS